MGSKRGFLTLMQKKLIMLKCNLKLIMLTELNDISQKQLAKELKINYAHFNRIVNGEVCPNLETAIKIANHIKIPVEEIWILE